MTTIKKSKILLFTDDMILFSLKQEVYQANNSSYGLK